MTVWVLSAAAIASNSLSLDDDMDWLVEFTLFFSVFCFLYHTYMSVEAFIQIHLGYTVASIKNRWYTIL